MYLDVLPWNWSLAEECCMSWVETGSRSDRSMNPFAQKHSGSTFKNLPNKNNQSVMSLKFTWRWLSTYLIQTLPMTITFFSFGGFCLTWSIRTFHLTFQMHNPQKYPEVCTAGMVVGLVDGSGRRSISKKKKITIHPDSGLPKFRTGPGCWRERDRSWDLNHLIRFFLLTWGWEWCVRFRNIYVL